MNNLKKTQIISLLFNGFNLAEPKKMHLSK